MRSCGVAALLSLLVPATAIPGPAQEWTAPELDRHTQGFHQDGLIARLRQVAALVAQQGVAGRAIRARIHGDHREYLLRVQELLDQLTDERWLTRESAQRRLLEIGARARVLLEEHAHKGRLLEERIRCRHILNEINARGTQKEEREVELLRGLVATAPYLHADEALRQALVSALGHTDTVVVDGAIHALGIVGGDDAAASVSALVGGKVSAHRRSSLAALARMRSPRALRLCAEFLQSSTNVTESMIVLRVLRGRPDAAAVIEKIARGSQPLLRRAAALTLAHRNAKPTTVRLPIPDWPPVEFHGLTGDGILVSSPVKGLSSVEVPFADCNVLELRAAHPQKKPGTCRVFLSQGSLLSGKLVGLNESEVTVQSPVFGRISVARADVQGLALDPALDRLIGASFKFDRLRLRDSSFVDGSIQGLQGDKVQVSGPDGGSRGIDVAKVAGILFQRPEAAPDDRNLYARIDLVSGDRLLGHLAVVDATALGVVVPSVGDAVIGLDQVARIELGVGGGALWGFTLIADYSDNRVVEVDEHGRVVFELDEILGAWDAECLPNGNLLITEFSVSRVQEITRKGKTVWSFEDLRNPYDADRLPNGNTLIADTFRGRVIEVDPAGKIVWEFKDGIRPFDADRLPSGNTLIADVLKDRVIEIDAEGTIVWEKKTLPNVHDADRLRNGNTLITLRTLNKVIEVDRAGKVVWKLEHLSNPSDADRLPNGHTLVAENGGVREFDRKGAVVWKKEMTWAVEVNRY